MAAPARSRLTVGTLVHVKDQKSGDSKKFRLVGSAEADPAEQKRLRAQGINRGIGFASFIEVTNPSAAFYGVGGAKISAQDGVTIRLDAQGAIICQTGVTEQGQGAEAVIAQVAASAFGVPI